MVKSYLRYECEGTFGVICSGSGRTVYDKTGKWCLCPSLERVAVWNVKDGTLVCTLDTPNNTTSAEVTQLCLSPSGEYVAVGYDDGHVRLWSLETRQCAMTLHGHRSAVTALAYNTTGTLLASGSKDSDIVMWDPLGETGLYRLKGHKNQITDLQFVERTRQLVSSSVDTFVKVWELDTQFCVQTVVEHRHAVWSLAVNATETQVITGSVDTELRVFAIRGDGDDNGGGDGGGDKTLTLAGSLFRQSVQRVSMLRFDPQFSVLACQNADRTVEMFAVRDAEQAKRKMKRRLRRVEKKSKKRTADTDADADADADAGGVVVEVVIPADEYGTLLPLRASHKVASLAFPPVDASNRGRGANRVLLALLDNSVVVYQMTVKEKVGADETPYTMLRQLDQAGHRSGIRSLAVSDDGTRVVSTSSKDIKVWSMDNGQCIHTMESGYALSCMLLPGAQYAVVGTKSGELELWNVHSATLVEKIQAHTGAVWDICMHPDGMQFVSGGVDTEVKFWEFEYVNDTTNAAAAAAAAANSGRQLSLVLTKSLVLTDTVMCLKISPCGRYLAVGLIDSTVRVFHTDTLKFFLSLYGHKLPVLSIDISSDSSLLVSASADKNVKLWGMDFGDCHRSLFAHNDSVMRVQFVPRTHYFFTAGKDRRLKYWDGDTFEEILTFEHAHHAEVWAMAVNSVGDAVVTAGNDRCIRVWREGEDQVFLEEEREKRLEAVFDQGAVVRQKAIGSVDGGGDDGDPRQQRVVGGVSTAVVDGRQQTSDEGLRGGERIIEALDIMRHEETQWSSYHAAIAKQDADADDDNDVAEPSTLKAALEAMQGVSPGGQRDVPRPPHNPYLLGMSPDRYLLRTLRGIRASDMEEALMVVPFDQSMQLLRCLKRFVECGVDVELVSTCILFLLDLHHRQLLASKQFMGDMLAIRQAVHTKLRAHKDMFGFNLAAMRYIDGRWAERSHARFFGDAADADKMRAAVADQKKKKKTRRQKQGQAGGNDDGDDVIM